MNPRPRRVVVIEVTTACNLSCAFCAYDRRLPFVRTALPEEQLRHVLMLLQMHAQQTQQPQLISWIGGEPLLRKDLCALTAEFSADPRLQFSLTTNGTRLREATVRAQLAAYFAEVTVSVDDLGAAHDSLRGQPGLFAQLKAGVMQLRAEAPRLKLRANVVLMRDTLPRFAALCEELASWGIDEISFNQLGGRDRPEFFAQHRLSVAQAEALPDLLAAIRQRLQSTRTRLVHAPGYLQRIQASAQNRPLPMPDCAPGEQFLFIDAQGRAAPCSFTGKEYGIDLLRQPQIAELPLQFRTARASRPAAACADCHANFVHGKFSNTSADYLC